MKDMHQASSISLQDCLLRHGIDFHVTSPISLPAIPGQGFVGNIVARGRKGKSFRNGALLAGFVRTGGNARYISVPAQSLVEAPSRLDPAEAVSMVYHYATAYQCLKLVADRNVMFAMDGQRVLVVGGLDGVGQALIDLCMKAKAVVYATAHDRRHSYVRSVLGATPLPECASEWSTIVEGEMDIVFDGVCQNGLSSSLKSLNQSGTLVCFGRSSLLQQKMGLFGAPLSAHLDMFRTQFSARIKVVDIWEIYKNDPESYKVGSEARMLTPQYETRETV